MRLAVVVTVTALLELARAGPNDCPSNIAELGTCDHDEGPIYPRDGQAVYLRDSDTPGAWKYPRASGYVWYDYHPERDITETEESWAKWIWHDCGEGYVCLESGKYPNYYLYTGDYLAIDYSSAPKEDYWSRLKIQTQKETSKGIYYFLTDERWLKDDPDYRYGVGFYLYIPPRCEGFKLILDIPNCSTGTIKEEYSYEQGVTRNSKSTTTVSVEISASMGAEIMTGILSASRGVGATFSATWVQERGSSVSERTVRKTTNEIPPGKRLFIYQEAATYGDYIWWSSKKFLYCTKDVGSYCN